MSKHTPGPWVISNNSAFLIRAGDADTGRHIAQVGPANYHPSFSVDEPNARLISAAPDMLDVLDMYSLPLTGDYRLDCAEFGAYAVMRENARRAAVKKARGEA